MLALLTPTAGFILDALPPGEQSKPEAGLLHGQFKLDAACEALLKLFDMLGDDPIVAAGRRKMFNLMH